MGYSSNLERKEYNYLIFRHFFLNKEVPFIQEWSRSRRRMWWNYRLFRNTFKRRWTPWKNNVWRICRLRKKCRATLRAHIFTLSYDANRSKTRYVLAIQHSIYLSPMCPICGSGKNCFQEYTTVRFGNNEQIKEDCEKQLMRKGKKWKKRTAWCTICAHEIECSLHLSVQVRNIPKLVVIYISIGGNA